MIFIVNAENRSLFVADIQTMHRHRKSVFVDGLGWRIAPRGDLEIDLYDTEASVYLIAKAHIDGEVLASARLLPTLTPHLMSDCFAHACTGDVLRGAQVWEASRFCAAPSVTSRRERVHLLWEIFGGIMETAFLFGVEQVTFTANSALLPLAMKCGWRAVRLGPTLPDGDDQVTAVAATMTSDGLQRIKAHLRTIGPVTRFITPASRIAA